MAAADGAGPESASDEAPGLLASGEPAFALLTLSAGWRDTTRRNALPNVTTLVPVTADSSIHAVRDTGGLWRGLPGKCHLDSAILRAPLGGVVRGDGSRRAEPPRRDQVRLHALRDQILHHRFGTLVRQHLVRRDALPLQRRPDWGVVGIAVHHDLRLLKRRQSRGQLGDDLLPLRGHLPGARLEQQVAVDGVLDGGLQPGDLHLVGGKLLLRGGYFRGTLRRLSRRRLLKLLILPLQIVILSQQIVVLSPQTVVFDLQLVVCVL